MSAPAAPLAELAALPLMEGLTEPEVASVAARMRTGDAPAGAVLGREGESGEDFWLLLDGRVAVTVQTRHGTRTLAECGPGAVLGELALLRNQPRTATVTALTPCRYLAGGTDALDTLISLEPVARRLRRLASSRLAEDVRPVPVRLPGGEPLLLRPLLPHDRDALDAALHQLSRQTLRRRFFSAGTPSPALVDYLVDIDYMDHFAWVALDGATGAGVALARYIRGAERSGAEMAFTAVDTFQGRGIGTLLLGALGVAAREAGLQRLYAYVMEDNGPMRAVFSKAGGVARFDEPGLLLVDVDPARAAALLDEPTGAAISAAAHDVVTAASLALA